MLETIDYYPYGQEFQTGTVSDGNGAVAVADALDETLQPYRFNGKESQSFAGLPYLDYGARFYHPLSTRWTTMDPLAEKYYFLSPYAYCSGNPVNFVDPDGKDFTRKVRKNTIYISAVYYTDGNSKKSAKQAVAFWNKRKGDTYTDESGKTYQIKYELIVADKGVNMEKQSDKKYSDKNTYNVNDKLVKSPNATGQTNNGKHVSVRKSYSINKPGSKEASTTGAHEIGHTLGMDHKESGIMSKSQDENRTPAVPQENINEMVESDRGKNDILSSLFQLINKIF